MLYCVYEEKACRNFAYSSAESTKKFKTLVGPTNTVNTDDTKDHHGHQGIPRTSKCHRNMHYLLAPTVFLNSFTGITIHKGQKH
jgi:hypothetical protein